MTMEHDLRDKARDAMKQSYAPYSHFNVGSCILADDDNYYAGCNVENASYSLTFCAEGNALCHMISAGAKKIKAIAVVCSGTTFCPPCGACRQRILEFSLPETRIYLFKNDGQMRSFTIEEMIPHSFGAATLELT